MSYIDNTMRNYKAYTKALAKANRRNKAVVFDALATAGITSVIVEFDGEGDSGQIESIIASAGETPVTLAPTPVTLHRVYWGSDKGETGTPPLSEAIEAVCYDYLKQDHGGWEDNDGAFGSFVFDVAARTIALEFNGRYTDVHTSTNTY